MVGWHTRRQHMADQLGHVGAELLEAIQRDLAQRKRLNLRDAGILLGIMLDKAEFLSERTGWADGDVSAEQSHRRHQPSAGRHRVSRGRGMTDLLALTEQMAAAVLAVQEAEREARNAGQIKRAITFQLMLRSGADALLALAELLGSEGTPYPRPRGGGRRLGGGRVVTRGGAAGETQPRWPGP